MVDRIKKLGRAIKKAIAVIVPGEHELKGTLNFDVWYPDHPPRTESSIFAATRAKLIDSGASVCWICGAKSKLEAHHFHVEWAFADAVDWEKMKILHPAFDWTAYKAAQDFVDSEYNMVILCETHHRHKNHGIHNLPYPIWVMQRHQRPDFKLFMGEDTSVPPTPDDS